MDKLIDLNASGHSGIDDDGIKNLHIQKLYAHNNIKITKDNLFIIQ
jgi:hypothetical protein